MLLGRELHGTEVSEVTRLCSPQHKGGQVCQRQQRVPDRQYAVTTTQHSALTA